MRRSLAPVIALTLALCAWLHARGLAALIGGDLGAPSLHLVNEAQAAPEPPRSRSADPILARNPFDSVTGPLGGTAPPRDDLPTEAMRACEGVRVISIVDAEDPDWSLVALHVPGERGPILRRRGEEVVAIAVDRVVLVQQGKQCLARIFAPPAPDPALPHPDALAPRNIVRTGPDSFALDRSARDALLEGAGDLMRAVAVRPESQNGEVIGLRIATLKPGTALDALGVRSGDVLLSVDGLALTSPDALLGVYARLRTEERVRLVMLREGRQLQLDYEVR